MHIKMVVQLKEYTSAQALADVLDKDLSDTKSSLGEYLHRLDEIRILAEKSKKVREVIMKLAGKKTDTTENSGEITVGILTVVLDADAFQELTAIESVVRSHQERLSALQKVRDALKWLDQLGDTQGLKYIVLENEGIPQRILFKIS